MIRKMKSGKYRLYSRKKDEHGHRRNLGTFGSRRAAEKHERAVQYFKHHSGCWIERGTRMSPHCFCRTRVGIVVSHNPSSGGNPGGRLRIVLGLHRHQQWQAAPGNLILAQLDLAAGTLNVLGLAAESPNPSFLALHPSGKFLYAVGESGSGKIRGFSINPADGALTFLNQESSGGDGPCHVAVDATGKNALSANYSGGSVAVLPIGADGKLSPPSCVIQHQGSSINPKRQTKPYAHSINFDPAQKFAIACDLGCDKLFVYRFDADAGKLTPNNPPSADIKPGSGPRHMAFSSDGKFAYVVNEMGSSITAFSYDADRGTLKQVQMISTLPSDFSEENTGRGNHDASVRQISIRIESRAKQHRDLRSGSINRQVDCRRISIDTGQDAAIFWDRSEGADYDRAESELGFDGVDEDRSKHRKAFTRPANHRYPRANVRGVSEKVKRKYERRDAEPPRQTPRGKRQFNSFSASVPALRCLGARIEFVIYRWTDSRMLRAALVPRAACRSLACQIPAARPRRSLRPGLRGNC